MQQNTTDLIAKSAWEATKTYWKEFIVLPFIVSAAVGLIQFFALSQMRPGPALFIIFILLGIFLFVFGLSFSTALLKWCSEIYAGKKEIDVQGGMRYGLSRFWGVLGTLLLTMIKVTLWSLLLIIPGLYKGMQYSQSIKVSQLEKISGGKANQMSQKLIMKVGFLRTLGNLMGVNTVTMVVMYVVMALIGVVGIILFAISLPETIVSIALGAAGLVVALFASAFMLAFSNFQYLYYRDEEKDLMSKTAKAMAQI